MRLEDGAIRQIGPCRGVASAYVGDMTSNGVDDSRGIGLDDRHRHMLWRNPIDGMKRYCDVGVRIYDLERVPNMHAVTMWITHYREQSASFLSIPLKLEPVAASVSK